MIQEMENMFIIKIYQENWKHRSTWQWWDWYEEELKWTKIKMLWFHWGYKQRSNARQSWLSQVLTPIKTGKAQPSTHHPSSCTAVTLTVDGPQEHKAQQVCPLDWPAISLKMNTMISQGKSISTHSLIVDRYLKQDNRCLCL